MGKRKKFVGLRFNYKYEGKAFMDKYETIEDFLNAEFPKNNNPMSPNYDTEIFNLTWNGRKTSISDKVKTVADLKDILAGECYITNVDIRLTESSLERKSTHSIEEVREVVKDVLFYKDKRYAKVELDGDIIKGNSQRYQTFFTKGTKCVCCGIEGKYFAKEKVSSDKSYHLNLYAIDENGKEVLMTKDHILPKSKGGQDHVDNYQPMCVRCNKAKGNNIEE
ncbi:MAG: HNH endonuclease [Alphaproteobacteria bacterium]|nr:HNH endonuclease [Alphaproteobacteria bacterium]